MNESLKKRLSDALQACLSIQNFTTGVDYESYARNEMLRAAVERKFEILGEALHQAAGTQPDLTLEIPELRRIVGMRNLIIHGYDAVDDEIVWSAIQLKIPPLIETLIQLLAE